MFQPGSTCGHAIKEGLDTTSWYETYDRDYLSESRDATDLTTREFVHLMRKRRLLPKMQNSLGPSVVTGGKS